MSNQAISIFYGGELIKNMDAEAYGGDQQQAQLMQRLAGLPLALLTQVHQLKLALNPEDGLCSDLAGRRPWPVQIDRLTGLQAHLLESEKRLRL